MRAASAAGLFRDGATTTKSGNKKGRGGLTPADYGKRLRSDGVQSLLDSKAYCLLKTGNVRHAAVAAECARR